MEQVAVLERVFSVDEKRYIEGILNKLKSAKAKQNYLVTFQSFKEFIDRPLLSAAPEDINRYLIHLEEEGMLSKATLETKYSQLYRLYQFLSDRGILSFNPLTKVEKPIVTRNVKKERTLTELEMNKLVATANNLPLREKSIVLLFLTTGMQLSEAAALSWGDFVMDSEGKIAVVIEKRRRGKHVKIAPAMWQLLCDYRNYLTEQEGRELSDVSPLFFSQAGKRISQTYIQKTVKSTCQLAGIPVHPPKDLRHSVAKFSILAGSSLEKVGDMLGVSDDFLVKRYNYVLDDINDTATDKLYFKILRT